VPSRQRKLELYRRIAELAVLADLASRVAPGIAGSPAVPIV